MPERISCGRGFIGGPKRVAARSKSERPASLAQVLGGQRRRAGRHAQVRSLAHVADASEDEGKVLASVADAVVAEIDARGEDHAEALDEIDAPALAEDVACEATGDGRDDRKGRLRKRVV